MHQIVLFYLGRSKHIAVSCTCLKAGKSGHVPLASGAALPAGQAIGAWRQHMTTIMETTR